MKSRLFQVSVSLLGLALAGCSNPLLDSATQNLDDAYEMIVSGPADDPGRPLGPEALISFARQGGPDFIDVQLKEAAAQLELDQRKSERFPRLSTAFRNQVTVQSDGSFTSRRDASVALDWDLVDALFFADEEGLALAETFLPIQSEIAMLDATNRLFQSYFAHEEVLLEKRALQARIEASACRAEALRLERDLGLASQASVEAVESATQTLRRQLDVVNRSVRTARLDVLYLAGVAQTAQVAINVNPADALPLVPASISEETCYAKSGHALRDALLMKGAQGALARAELQRYGNFDLRLPARLTPDSGLDLNVLMSVLIPIIDQSDSERSIQSARLALLELAIGADRSRRSFATQLGEARLARAKALSRLSEIRAVASLSENEGDSCEAVSGRVDIKLDVARATLALQQAETAIAVLCTPLDGTSRWATLDTNITLDAAAPAD